MIRSALRLLVLYFLVWLLSLQWDGAYTVFNKLTGSMLESVHAAFAAQPHGAVAVGIVFCAFGAVALLWNMVQLPFWVCAVRVEKFSGPTAHPYKRQPLRVDLRFRVSRFMVVLTLQMLGLLLMLRVLPVLVDPASVPTSGWLAALNHLSGQEVWLFYGVSHLLVIALVWVGTVSSNEVAAKSQRESYGFFTYQVQQAPLSRLALRVLAFGHFPVAAFAATSHPHPMHSVVVVASLSAVLVVAALAQAITLILEARHQRWLNRLDAGARNNDAVRAVREHAIRFLHPRLTVIPEATFVPVNPADAAPPQNTAGNAIEQLNPAAHSSVLPDDEAELSEDPDDPGPRYAGPGVVAYIVRVLHGFRTWMFGLLAVLAVGVAAFAYQWFILPSANETRQLARSAHIHIRKHGGDNAQLALLGTRYDYSLNTGMSNVSKHFINAVIASEDHRFFEHGVTYKLSKFAYAGLRCVWRMINVFSSRNGCRGNSTIGQQLARNLFISEERSLIRKFKELVWSIKMEYGLTKKEILQAYLNRIYLGDGNFGVEMASRSYFGKSASRLHLHEAALLASAVKRPGWNWHQDRAGAIKRARIILLTMRRYGFAPANARFPKTFAPRMGGRSLRRPYLGHLWQFIRADVQQVMSGLPDGDYKLLTSLNAEVQVYARRRLSSAVRRLQARGVQVSQGAAVVMRPNGAVLAMVGGVGDDLSGRGINRAKRTQGLLARPPASAFKPVVYLAALETGLAPDSPISAAPVNIAVPGSEPYAPSNHDGKTYGTVTLSQGLVHSINTAAVNVLHEHVGFDALLDTAQRLGIDSQGMKRQWGLALGQSGVPVVTMAGAYAAFANGGYRVKPHAFLAITNEDGRTVWRRERPRNRRVFKREVVSRLNEMLEQVTVDGTGFRARRGLPENVHIAGKTGTGDGFVDAWFIGYGADIVVAIWMGNDRPVAMANTYGGGAPAQVFNEVLRDLYTHTDLISLQAPLP